MPQDDVRPLYRVILALGAAGAVILVLGLIEFVHFEPPGQQTGTSARVDGVFRYDARTKQVSGGDSTHFQRDEPFAARVDWSSLPGDLRVGAGWFDNFGQEVGKAGPAPAAELVDHGIVPAAMPQGLNRNFPGRYLFVVERYRGDLPVEVLARRTVLVVRGT